MAESKSKAGSNLTSDMGFIKLLFWKMMFVYDPLTRVNFISQILLSENIAYDFGYNLYPGSGKTCKNGSATFLSLMTSDITYMI